MAAQLPLEDTTFIECAKTRGLRIDLNPDGTLAESSKNSTDYRAFKAGLLKEHGGAASLKELGIHPQERPKYWAMYWAGVARSKEG